MNRGIQNNNPGNLRYKIGVNWKGQTGHDDKGFAVFNDPVAGIRALALDLFNSNQLQGRDTIAKITAHYAPPSENDTQGYAIAVSNFLGVSVDQPINLTDYDLASRYIRAVIIQESGLNNGAEWYTPLVIARAMEDTGKWATA
jgi:hypothetical protein